MELRAARTQRHTWRGPFCEVQNLQHAGVYSACVKAVAPCGAESTRSPWTTAPVWYPSYVPGARL